MNRFTCSGLITCLCIVVSGSACTEKKTSNPKVVLAHVDGKEVTLDQYKDEEFYLYSYSQLNIALPDQRLKALVESEVLTDEAEKLKIQDQPKIRRKIQQIIISELLREELTKPERQLPITDQEAVDYYNQNISRFRSPETVHYAHILIDLPDKKAAHTLAEKILQDPSLAQSTRFQSFVERYSADKSTLNCAGDLGIAMVPDSSTLTGNFSTWQTKLVMAAASVKTDGGIYQEVVETERGFHIVKLIAHQQARTESFDEVKPQILSYLAMDHQARIYNEYIEELIQKHEVEVDTARVSELGKSGALNIPDQSP